MVTAIITTTMGEGTPHAGMMRLLAWLSPAFPVGAFSYSHGLERAVHDGLVADAAGLQTWLVDLIEQGSQWNDAVLAAEAWRIAREGGDLTGLVELGAAMAGGLERHMETTLQGGAFAAAAARWQGGTDDLPPDCPYPVAVGAYCARARIGLADMLAAYLQAFAINQMQAGIRLSLFGQSDGLAMLAALEGVIADTAARAAHSSLDDLGGCTFMAEIAAIDHETQRSRLFRS